MRPRTKLPSDVELADRVAFGLTARQLVILGGAAVGVYLVFAAMSSVLPLAFAAAATTPLGIVAVLLALGRLHGVSLDRLAALGVRHLAVPRRRVLAPSGLPDRDGRPSRSRIAPLRLPVRAVLRSGVVALDGSRFCILLRASGTSFQLRSDEEQASLVEAFGRFLNGLSEPVQITIRSEPLDLEARATALHEAAATLPHPALADAAGAHARFLRQLAGDGGIRRREILLVLSTQARGRDAAAAVLERRADEAADLLAGAALNVNRLDGDATAQLLARTLDPPGPPPGSHLDGDVRAC